jgi:drug/metabolite transporter (DMT)-like permease
MTMKKRGNVTGIAAALSSALFLGLTPIFGKQAITFGFSPLATVALRSSMAAGLLLLIFVLFRRSYLYIYPAGLLGCGLAGAINGIGSVFYYLALGRLSVGIGQLIYSLYPIFLVIWLVLDHQVPTRMTHVRIALSLVGVILLTSATSAKVDWTGVFLMLGASVMYAIHLPINQHVLYDIPAPTVTLYTLLAMSAVTVPTYLIFDRQLPVAGTSWGPIFALTFVTFASRLMLFLGVKHLGGMQTALLGLSELIVAVTVSHFWLHESFLPLQWVGAAFLATSLMLIGFEKIKPEERRSVGGLLSWLRPPGIPWDPHS